MPSAPGGSGRDLAKVEAFNDYSERHHVRDRRCASSSASGHLSLPLAVVLPGGRRIGRKDAAVTLRLNDLSPLAHLVTGEVGKVGEDYVEGKRRPRRRHARADGGRRRADAGRPDPAARRRRRRRSPGCARPALMARSRLRHRPEADAEQVQFHYDVSDDFYALWLDPRRVYSCAYFRDAGDVARRGAGGQARAHLPQADAQAGRALPRHRRRLGRPAAVRGRALRRAGAGHHAEQEPARPRQQADRRARPRPAACAWTCSTTAHLDESEPYDKIASVGMFEHVGRAHLPEYFAKIRRLLKPGGLLLNHGITAGGTRNHQLGSGLGEFIEKYIFPGGELEHVSHVLERDRRRRARGGRRREPAPALREDALGLERRARGAARRRRARSPPTPCCAPTGSISRAARCASSAPGSRCTRCCARGRPATSSRGRCAAHNRSIPFNRGYMYPQR